MKTTTPTPTRRSAEWAAATREHILDAAERLFADHGIEGVSLREITREAGVNIAAIHYHYGSREALVRAVLDRVIVPLNRMRIELLDEGLAANDGRPLPLSTILEAFVGPDLVTIERLRSRGRGVATARFLGRTYNQPTPNVGQLMQEQFAEVAERFFTELVRTLPNVPRDEIEWRMSCVVGVIVALFAQATPHGVPGPFDTTNVDETLGRIIAFVGPGLSAPANPVRRQGKGQGKGRKT